MACEYWLIRVLVGVKSPEIVLRMRVAGEPLSWEYAKREVAQHDEVDIVDLTDCNLVISIDCKPGAHASVRSC